ncbi:hypothetical protein, partial [Brevibacterium samyangense]
RIRVIGLSPAAFESGARDHVRGALTALSDLAAAGRPVPDFGDRVLADQLVVLLTDCLPEYGADPVVTERALTIATDLRRDLAEY